MSILRVFLEELLAALASVDRSVTISAERDEILFRVISGMAPELNMMNMKLLFCTAILAAPSVTIENLPAELSVVIGL